MSHSLTIGKLSKQANVSIDSIRFYERRGLLADPVRTESNYRVYPLEAAGRLRFIKKAQNLGFSLGEIQGLLDLSRMLKALEQLDESCDGQGPIVECPILKALAEDDGLECHH